MQMGNSKSFVGIDVSKQNLDIFILPQREGFQVCNTQNSIADLCQQLKPYSPELIVMESSGGYEVAVFQALHEAGFRVARENAKNIYHHGKSRGKRAKTDGIDAETLAHYAWCYTDDIRTNGPSSQSQESLRQLMERRQELLAFQTAEKNRLKAPALNPGIKESCQRMLRSFAEEIKCVNDLITQTVAEQTDWQQKRELLKSVIGVGEITASALLAWLPELGNLPNKQLAALVGVVPYHRESGQYTGQRHIQGGRTAVRTILYMATLTAIRQNLKVKGFYKRLRDQGKASKVAMIACMHKLLRIMNAMIRQMKPFEPELSTAN